MAKQANSTVEKITPLGDRVLIRPFEESELESKTDSGIILPETVKKDKPEQGEVVAVGEGRYENGELVKPRVEKGDKVIFSKFGYDEVAVESEEYYLLKEDNILAIIK